MNSYVIFFVTLLLSFLLTGLVRFYALRKSILDIPNDRSSHSLPTPRGGGLAIVIAFLSSIIYLALIKSISTNLFFALLGGSILIAGIGFLDDCFQVSVRWRFFIHFIAACWALYFLGGFPVMNLGVTQIHLGWFGIPLAILGIMWLTNLYNFMDGIDGFAGMEGVFVASAGGIILLLSGFHSFAMISFLLAASILGFLIWNWPPAKIFMGDVGSSALGYIFAVFIVASAHLAQASPLMWIILLGIFIGDSTFTVIHRLIKKENLSTAHRTHAYQELVQRGLSHFAVMRNVLLINIFILFPLAYWGLIQPILSAWIFFMTFLIAFLTWYKIITSKRA